MSCKHGVDYPDPCPACEDTAERAKEDRKERRARIWTERGERWAEDVIYGETR